MSTTKRNGNKWTIRETLSLQREYELLEWTVQEIAAKHERSVNAILFKLLAENFIASWNDARGFDLNKHVAAMLCQDDDDDIEDELNFEADDEDEDDEDYVDDNTSDDDDDEPWNLKDSITEISNLVKMMFETMVAAKNDSRTQRALRGV
jgi:hypothetical protein